MEIARALGRIGRGLRGALLALGAGALGTPAAAEPAGLVVASVSVPGIPYASVATRDGAVLFVSVSAGAGGRTGVAVFRRTPAALVPLGFVALRAPRALGLALPGDEATLLVADGDGLALVDARAARRGRPAPARYVRPYPAPSTVEVVASRDGRLAYVSEARRAAVAVFRLSRRADGAAQAVPAGEIPVERAPGALALSPGGDVLYVASRSPHGTLSAVDTTAERAGRRPRPVRVEVGRAPAQLALSADGASLWIALQGENRVVAYDTRRLRADPARAVPFERVSTGLGPAAIALVRDDGALAVAGSNRFDPSAAGPAATFYDVRGEPAVINGFATGAAPVRFSRSPDRATLYLTNAGSRTVQAIDAFHAVQPGE